MLVGPIGLTAYCWLLMALSADGYFAGGNLSMCYCRLIVLPESFGDMNVGGDLDLHGNVLTIVPDSFGAITVRGEIDLRMNELHVIPASIGSLVVGKTLRLNSNTIVHLPEQFQNIRVGGDLDLRCNHLMDYAAEFFERMLVDGTILYGDQTVFDAECHAALAAQSDAFGIDPDTGAFTFAPPVNEELPNPDNANSLAPNVFPENMTSMATRKYMPSMATLYGAPSEYG